MNTKSIFSIDDYLNSLQPERKKIIEKIYEIALKNLDPHFESKIQNGMISFIVPLEIYPEGYLKNSTPLPFLSIASQKNYISVYHMAIYKSKSLLDWYRKEYEIYFPDSKINMGKSCIRFSKFEDIPYNIFKQLFKKINVNDWISIYEKTKKSNIIN